MTVADKVKMRREELGLSQAELANKLGLKSRSSVTRIEKSGDEISLKDVERLSVALDCSPLYLMGWDNEDDNKNRVKEQRFVELYNQLTDSEKIVVDKLLESLTSGK